jgi:hypothetical protein
MPVRLLAACCCWLALCGTFVAAASDWEEAEIAEEEEDLAKTLQNPLANLSTLPFQFNLNDGARPPGSTKDRTAFNLNIQPVVPFPGEKWNVISRTIIPVNSVPQGDSDSTFGVGDTSLSLFWSPAKPGKAIWGVGPALSLPTASSEILGSEQLAAGPTGVIFYGVGKWTMGAVASNVWSVSHASGREDVNRFFANWFLNYNLSNGWAVGSAPIITCDWQISSGDECTVPWGAQLSKVTRFGDRPVNLLLGYYANSQEPTGAPDSQIRIQVNLLFPQKNR